MKNTSSFFSLGLRVFMAPFFCALVLLGALSGAQAQSVSLTPTSISQVEGNTGQATTVQFLATLSRSSSTAITVNYTTSDGTATAGSDYIAATSSVTFPAGSTRSQPIALTVTGDSAAEGDETFTLRITSSAPILNNTGTVLIKDDEPQPKLAVDDAPNAVEPLPGTTTTFLPFNVTLGPASSKTVTVQFSTRAGLNTVDGVDYVGQAGTLTFAAGETLKTVNVQLKGDYTDETERQIFVDISNGLQGSAVVDIVDRNGVGFVTDDDGPAISIDDAQVSEGDDNDVVSAVFPISLDAPSPEDTIFDVSTAAVTATADADFTAITTPVRILIPAGSTNSTTEVRILNDNTAENTEFFLVRLTLVNGPGGTQDGTVLLRGQATCTIFDDDAAPFLRLRKDESNPSEGESGTRPYRFVAELVDNKGVPSASDQDISFSYQTTQGANSGFDQATSAIDFNAAQGTVRIAAGQLTNSFSVAIRGDFIDERNEQFKVLLSNAINSRFDENRTSIFGTIVDDDSPTLSLLRTPEDAPITEGNTGLVTPVNLRVLLSEAPVETATVEYAVLAGTATRADGDYSVSSATGTLTFRAGSAASQLIPAGILVNGDRKFETDETFSVVLRNVTGGANLGSTGASSTVTILNDDTKPKVLVQAAEGSNTTNLAKSEGALDSQTPFAFKVVLNRPSSVDTTVTVTLGAATDTATATEDYSPLTPATTTLTIPAGSTTANLTVQVIGDDTNEADEVFTVTAVGDVNTSPNPLVNFAKGTILNDDARPFDVQPSQGLFTNEDGDIATFTVRLSVRPTSNVDVQLVGTPSSEVRVSVAGQSSETPTLTFTPDNFSDPQTVTLTGVDDDLADGSKPFQILGSVTTSDPLYGTFPVISGVNNDNEIVNTGPVTFQPNTTYFLSFPAMSSYDGGQGVNDRVKVDRLFDRPISSGGVENFELFRFNPNIQVLGEAQDRDSLVGTDLVRRGMGYKLNVGANVLTLNAGLIPNPAAVKTFPIELKRNPNFSGVQSQNGFNLIGFPFNPTTYRSVNFTNSRVKVGDLKFETVTAAAAAGVMSDKFFTRNSSGQFVPINSTTRVLQRYRAVYVQTFIDGVTLVLRNPDQ